MSNLWLIESDITHIVDELCSEDHRKEGDRLFLEFCEYDEAFEGRTDGPAGHEREFFFTLVARVKCLYITRLHCRTISDVVDELLLVVEDDDLIASCEIIEQGKYIIVLAFDPRIVR